MRLGRRRRHEDGRDIVEGLRIDPGLAPQDRFDAGLIKRTGARGLPDRSAQGVSSLDAEARETLGNISVTEAKNMLIGGQDVMVPSSPLNRPERGIIQAFETAAGA